MVYSRVQQALDSGLLKRQLCEIVSPPTKLEIESIASRLPFSLAKSHIELLLEWGGSLLDQIRIHSLENIKQGNEMLLFASDYDGYQFVYDRDGAVFSIDTDGGSIEKLAPSVSIFINQFFLGKEGVNFYGENWVEELRKYGFA